MEQKGDKNDADRPTMIIHALQTVLHLNKKQVIVYAVFLHQTNIVYLNGEPSAKHE